MKASSIFGWMLLAIVLVAALAYWDEERESQAALDDFAQEQIVVASAVASALGDPSTNAEARTNPRRFAAIARTIERRGAIRVFLATATSLTDVSGAKVELPPLTDAVRQGILTVRLSRNDAALLGLPARMALAGMKRIDGDAQQSSVVVVATAQVERDRERRAQWRLVLGVVVAAGLVLGFGGLAMRKQRTELELAHELDLSAVRTERDQRLVRADKLATMGAIATGIAHEVSTPLGVILGRAEQLLGKQPDERSRRAVETIAAQTERINAVIRGFLSLARGNQPALEHCAPARLVVAATELVEHRFEKADVRLSSEISEGLPSVACDPRLFEQVLVNLLLNACDACEKGGVVHISVRAETGRVAFVVTDDGVGISPEVAERAAEPFFTTKADGKGSGLGLAIANEIVKHHAGSLTLVPRAAGGTIATVELPTVETAGRGRPSSLFEREDHA